MDAGSLISIGSMTGPDNSCKAAKNAAMTASCAASVGNVERRAEREGSESGKRALLLPGQGLPQMVVEPFAQRRVVLARAGLAVVCLVDTRNPDRIDQSRRPPAEHQH